MNWYWLLYIPLGGLGIVGVITAIIVASKYKKSTPPAVAAGTTPAPPSRIPDWLKSRKVRAAVVFLFVLNGAMWFFHHYASQYFTIYNAWPLFLATNVVAGLWITALLAEASGLAKFGLFLLSWFLIGVGLLFYSQSPTEFKAQAAANEARLESQLPRSGEKVIEAPVGEWVTISFPQGSKSWYYDQGPHHIKLQNLDGWKAEDRGTEGSVSTPKGDTLPKRTFQFMSLEETPVQITLRWE